MTATVTSARAAACAWCGEPFDGRASVLAGRIRCGACGVATTDPWPSDHDLDAAYAGWYRPESGRFGGGGDLILRASRGTLARRLDDTAPVGRVLDVGSGDGTLLDALRRRGRDAVGTERGSDRPDVLAAEVEDVDGSFAAIVFWHSLEHLRAPGEALRHAAELLVPGGLLAVAIPNGDSIQARLFGDRWFGLDLPRHLTHAGAAALVSRLEALGLRVGRVSHWRGGQVLFGWLHGLVGALLPGHPDLYDAIRRPSARRAPLDPRERAMALAAAVLLFPLAAAFAALEIALRRGGTVYVEASRV